MADLEDAEEHTLGVTGFDDIEQRRAIMISFDRKKQVRWEREAPRKFKKIPYPRDAYKVEGYPDDAMVLTQELYDDLLKEYEGLEDAEHYADLEREPVTPDMVGKKWLVVVDYHT